MDNAKKESGLWPAIVLLCMAVCTGFAIAHVMDRSPRIVVVPMVIQVEARDLAQCRASLKETDPAANACPVAEVRP